MENHLKGKVIIFDGDSICHATSECSETNRGWASRVGERFEMKWHNLGISGGTVTAEMFYEGGWPRHWVSRNIDKIREEFPVVDYLIFEGGTNDSDLLGKDSERFGSLDPADFSGNYDDSTYTGALEMLFFKAMSYYPYAKIGYIVTPKMGIYSYGYGPECRRRLYFLRAIEVCKKWGVPYIDLWETAQINPALKCYYDPDLDREANTAAKKAYTDGQHLTALGYDMISNSIGEWIKGL